MDPGGFLGNDELVAKTRKKPPPRPGRTRRDKMPKLPPIGAPAKPTRAPVVRGPQVSMLDRLAADDAGDDDLPPPSHGSKQPTLASLDSWIVRTVAVPSEAKGYRAWGDRWTMQLEYVDCGRCPRAHGPYWYAYKRAAKTYRDRYDATGKLHKVYVGKRFDIEKARAKLVAAGVCRDRS